MELPNLLLLIFHFFVTTPWISFASPAPCEMTMSVEISSPQIFPNNSVLDQTSEIIYPSGTYWSLVNEDVTTYRGCPCSIDSKPCLRKCCPLGHMFHNRMCVPNNVTFALNVTNDGVSHQEVEGVKHFSLVFGRHSCNSTTHSSLLVKPEGFSQSTVYINSEDGRLVYSKEEKTFYLGPDSYCVDYFSKHDAHIPLICLPKSEPSSDVPSDVRLVIYPIFMIISVVFLLVTLVVYVVTPELRNLQGKCLICQIICLIVGYVFLSVSQIGGSTISDAVCISTAFIIQFSFLSTFFWLNVVCFEIFIAFSGSQLISGSIREKEKKKFILYSIYAWSCPVIILIVSLVMEFAPRIPHHHLKPRFGVSRCWFHNKMDALPYFYGPVSVLLTCNFIMFILTTIKVLKLNKMTSVPEVIGYGSSYENKEKRKRFTLCLTLFVVMGVIWVMDVLEWAVGSQSVFWILSDIANTLQGFFIFLVFLVGNKKVRSILLGRFCGKHADKWNMGGNSNNSRVPDSGANKSTTSSIGFDTLATENVKLNSVKNRDDEATEMLSKVS